MQCCLTGRMPKTVGNLQFEFLKKHSDPLVCIYNTSVFLAALSLVELLTVIRIIGI